MTASEYLQGLLLKYAVDNGPFSPLRELARVQIFPAVKSWAGDYFRDCSYAGSFAKSTGNNCSTDLDIFISLKSNAPELKKIFESLHERARNEGWAPRMQNVSIGTTISGRSVDLVPGRVQDGYQNWHSIYRRRSDSWTLTNIDSQIQLVIKSGRAQEIRLAKLWRLRAGFDCPSFLIELAVIEALRGRPVGDLVPNFWHALGWFADNFESARLIDPANTNNVVSDDLSPQEKRAVSNAARIARGKKFYSDILW